MDLRREYRQQVPQLQDFCNNIHFENIFGKLIMAKFRCRNHNLQIESDKVHPVTSENVSWTCTKYIWDKSHYILTCPYFGNL